MLYDYIIYFRCFVGPGYWGAYKHTLAFDDQHAQQRGDGDCGYDKRTV